ICLMYCSSFKYLCYNAYRTCKKMPDTTQKIQKPRDTARCKTISPETRSLETLHDLMLAIQSREAGESHLLAMLRATTAHISMHLGRPLTTISLRDLIDVKPGLQAHLRARRLKRNSIRSYTNYLRILVQKAKDFGWVEISPAIEKAWREELDVVRDIHGCPGLVRYAVWKGKVPQAFSEADLSD